MQSQAFSLILPFLSCRTRCLRWSVSCRPALLTLWSASAPTPAVSLTVLTAFMCPHSCNTSGCSRWSAWSVMDTRFVCLSHASSPGQCRQRVISIRLIYWLISLLRQNNYILSLTFLTVFDKNVKNLKVGVTLSLSLFPWSDTLGSLQVTLISVYRVQVRAAQSLSAYAYSKFGVQNHTHTGTLALISHSNPHGEKHRMTLNAFLEQSVAAHEYQRHSYHVRTTHIL